MADASSLYQKKLTTPEEAVEQIPRKGNLSFGLARWNPPALLAALAAPQFREDLLRSARKWG